MFDRSRCGTSPYFYATNPSDAALILTAGRLQKIVEIQEDLRSVISFSFVAGKCYMAILSDNWFDPSKYAVDDKDQLKSYYGSAKTILFLIDQLQLDQLL